MQNYKTVEKQYSEDGSQFWNYMVTMQDNKIIYVPLDKSNKDYQDVQQWIADGGTVIDNGGGE
jgi:hypothetical protein